MVSTVSHELKTPLTSVQMAIHLLLEELVGPLNPKQVELLLAARQDSERILTMINDLLDLTRIEHGRVQLELTAVPASELVDEAVKRFQPQAQSGGLVLTADVHGDHLTVMVDRERIEHVFDNLIMNAIQHTARGDRSASARSPTASVRGSWFATPARESRPSTSPASSRSSIAFPARKAHRRRRAWAWRSCARSSRPTAARSRSPVSPVKDSTFTFTLPAAGEIERASLF